MPELPPENRQRDPFAGEFDGQSMAELVGHKASPDAGFGGEAAELGADSALGQARTPRVEPSITQNSGPTGSCAHSASHGRMACSAQLSIPTSLR